MKLRSTNIGGPTYTTFRGRGGGVYMCVLIMVIFSGRKNLRGVEKGTGEYH